jgi:ankyrin repeat protein
MWGWTPICVALVEAGADLNDPIITGRTPLMLAVECENDLTVKFLLGKSAIHVNATDADGNTALILAAECGEYGNKVAKMLLQKGADPNVENRKKKSPLLIACKDQNMELVHALLDHKVCLFQNLDLIGRTRGGEPSGDSRWGCVCSSECRELFAAAQANARGRQESRDGSR